MNMTRQTDKQRAHVEEIRKLLVKSPKDAQIKRALRIAEKRLWLLKTTALEG
jgi:hypothetical protein